MIDNKKIGSYANERLSTGRDDRTDEHKLDLDSRLRGSVGERTANQIISAIDKIKESR